MPGNIHTLRHQHARQGESFVQNIFIPDAANKKMAEEQTGSMYPDQWLRFDYAHVVLGEESKIFTGKEAAKVLGYGEGSEMAAVYAEKIKIGDKVRLKKKFDMPEKASMGTIIAIDPGVAAGEKLSENCYKVAWMDTSLDREKWYRGPELERVV